MKNKPVRMRTSRHEGWGLYTQPEKHKTPIEAFHAKVKKRRAMNKMARKSRKYNAKMQ